MLGTLIRIANLRQLLKKQRERKKRRRTYASDEVGVYDGDTMGLEKIGDGALPR